MSSSRRLTRQVFFGSAVLAVLGVILCPAGLLLFFCSLLSFGRSFRVGIDTEHPDKLITTGVFALTRNPLYVAFALILVGEFLIFLNWILLLYTLGGIRLFHRQVCREEDFLKMHYGNVFGTCGDSIFTSVKE